MLFHQLYHPSLVCQTLKWCHVSSPDGAAVRAGVRQGDRIIKVRYISFGCFYEFAQTLECESSRTRLPFSEILGWHVDDKSFRFTRIQH